jgi:hypothetical protein
VGNFSSLLTVTATIASTRTAKPTAKRRVWQPVMRDVRCLFSQLKYTGSVRKAVESHHNKKENLMASDSYDIITVSGGLGGSRYTETFSDSKGKSHECFRICH